MKTDPVIDLNCDLGEGAGHDAELMPLVTSANIACGAHAGDPPTMRETVSLALRHGVAIGAHPGFADREFFGRRELSLDRAEIYTQVRAQVELLCEIAAREGGRVTHVKPHGALYNMAARETGVAAAVVAAVADVDPGLRLYGLAGGRLIETGRNLGLRVAAEVFADRTYQADGSLTLRGRENAVIENEADAIAQVLRMVREGVVRSIDGTDVAMQADTLCLHGDGPQAVNFARGVRRALLGAGVRISKVR